MENLILHFQLLTTYTKFCLFFLKTVGKFLLLTSITYQGYSLCHWKLPSKFKNETLLR